MLSRLLGKLYKKKVDTPEAPAETSSDDVARAPSAGGEMLTIEGVIQPAAPSEIEEEKAPPQAPATASEDAAETQQAIEEAATAAVKASVQDGECVDTAALEANIAEAIKTIYDPEIPVNIYELGLIYEVKVEPNGMANVVMTLTAPNCPAAGILPGQVESVTRGVDGVYDVHLDLTFEPPWTPDRMSDAAKLELGML